MKEFPRLHPNHQDDPELYERMFDPPHLGIPLVSTSSGRFRDRDGRYVEVFLNVRDNVAVQTGFLTNWSPWVMALASYWCDQAKGRNLKIVAALSVEDCFPVRLVKRAAPGEVMACLLAGRLAVSNARAGGTRILIAD